MFCKYLVSCIFWRSVIGFLMKYLICFSEIYWKSEIYSIIYLFFIIKIQFLDSGCYFWQSFQFFSFLYSVSVPKCGSKRFFDLFKSRWNMWTKRWSLLLTVLAYFLLLTYFEWHQFCDQDLSLVFSSEIGWVFLSQNLSAAFLWSI